MKATNLSRAIWNGIADLASRSQSPREVYFSEVTRVDAKKGLVWAKDFGDVAIPLVAFERTITYYDTVPVGNATSGSPVNTEMIRREDKTQTNPNFKTKIVPPSPGDIVIVIDPWGAKRFPMAVGILPDTSDAWTEVSTSGD